MKIDNFKIQRDGETVVVMKIGVSKKTREETLRPVAYTRDILSALQYIHSKFGVELLDNTTELSAIITKMEGHIEDIQKLVKEKCRECLNE